MMFMKLKGMYCTQKRKKVLAKNSLKVTCAQHMCI